MATLDVIDYYDILGVDSKATDTELRKAWRKKAIELHPDKHAGDDSAKYSQLFDTAKQAFELLSDSKQRSEYDAKLRIVEQQKQQAAERVKRYKTDSIHIQRMRDELNRQEAEFDAQVKQHKNNAQNLSKQNREFIDKIRAERQHQAYVYSKQSLHKTTQSNTYQQHTDDITSILIAWNINEPTAKLYTENYIRTAFSVYGTILQITINSKRGRCIVDYRNRSSAVNAMDIVKIDKNITVQLLDNANFAANNADTNKNATNSKSTDFGVNGSSAATAIEIDDNHATVPATSNANLTAKDFSTLADYEAYTKQRLKQKLAERKAKQAAQNVEPQSHINTTTEATVIDIDSINNKQQPEVIDVR